MGRDSLFGERIIWTGRPQLLNPPPFLRGLSLLMFVMALVSTSFAVVRALALGASPTPSLGFAAWCTTLGILLLHGPRIWLEQMRFTVTERHVIWRRGPFRRSIEREAISFARIFWDKNAVSVGDLELVRAVPTGALRRRLRLRLTGVSAPDRVWAIIRGQETVAPAGEHHRPLAQRLDLHERVLWSAKPRPSLRAYLPHGPREWTLILLAAALFAVLVQMARRMVPTLGHLIEAGLPAGSPAFLALVLGLGLSAIVVLALSVYFVYDAVVRRARLIGETRYLITDKRVLIQRGLEELHLGRDKIVDVIDAPARGGLTNVFLVLDGPRARALAASGAFGELDRSPHLRPVFELVEDAEGVRRILRAGRPSLPHAA
ncbi:MAG TPA: hypothetical protein VKZ49_13420 [Polyangiaceae bacterium]|nr:hypothetical protein [Polyangiaceae bacterium]